jgi:uncharacterized protein YjiK
VTAGLLSGPAQAQNPSFQRIATIPAFLNTPGADEDAKAINEAVAEIVDASEDGNTLVYTDSANDALGFVDITVPANPLAAGLVDLAGEPTAVAVKGDYALVGVNTSENFINTSGKLQVVHISTQAVVAEYEVGGQPDSVAVSPDKNYAAVAIENERDEDLGDGRPPQSPPGFVVAFNISNPDPTQWSQWDIDLTGIPNKFKDDPEPEFVDINEDNICAVTLQENNHVVLIDLEAWAIPLLGNEIVGDFKCGKVQLFDVDILENDLIEQVDFLTPIPREPDAIQWIGEDYMVTSDEGDLDGGTRGFTIYDTKGKVIFTSGNSIEHLGTRIGHYPEDRSENKGTEPEGAEFAWFGEFPILFIGSERSSIIAVYSVTELETEQGSKKQVVPEFVQVLPAGGIGPEGLKAIPDRGLFVVACEEDDRGDKFRAAISIYELVADEPTYPTIVSADRVDGIPIPWAALSALAADPVDSNTMYTVYDSFYRKSRIFEIDLSGPIPTIVDEIVLHNDEGNTFDLDPEGLTVRSDGTFWLASEGSGTVGDPDRPVTSNNVLYEVDTDGTVLSTVTLPASLNALQVRFGFEGVTSVGTVGIDEQVFVCVQREWSDDPDDLVKIGKYDVASETWTFAHYPLETPMSPNGGWVGLSEIVSIGDDQFLILERDNQGGTDARIKKIYQIDAGEVEFLPHSDPQAPVLNVLTKTEVDDLIPALEAPNGAIIEKVEGLTVLPNGDVYIVTDNDGVDDSNGETQLINLGDILP